jgi:hypothetical protein
VRETLWLVIELDLIRAARLFALMPEHAVTIHVASFEICQSELSRRQPTNCVNVSQPIRERSFGPFLKDHTPLSRKTPLKNMSFLKRWNFISMTSPTSGCVCFGSNHSVSMILLGGEEQNIVEVRHVSPTPHRAGTELNEERQELGEDEDVMSKHLALESVWNIEGEVVHM